MEQMNFIEKIQKLNVFWRKFILVLVIAGLGVPLGFLVKRNFQENLKKFNKEKFFQEVNLPKFKRELKNLPGKKEAKEKMEEINKLMEELGEPSKMATSSTSTDFSTSSNNQ